jgi:hypothetical protein
MGTIVTRPRRLKHARRIAALLALGMGIAGLSAPAGAQYLDGPAYSFPVTDMIGPAIAGSSMESYIGRNRQRKPPAPARKDETGRPGAEADLRIGSDPAVSQRVKADFRAQLLRSNPDRRDAIDRALAKDWLAGYRSEIAAPNRLDPRNLADAVAAYMIAAWAIVHKKQDISPRGIAGVRDHFRAAMAASPQAARPGAQGRQEMAEALIYRTVLIMANRVHIAKTRDARLADAASRHYRAAVKAGAKVDLQGLDLGDGGFVSGCPGAC